MPLIIQFSNPAKIMRFLMPCSYRWEAGKNMRFNSVCMLPGLGYVISLIRISCVPYIVIVHWTIFSNMVQRVSFLIQSAYIKEIFMIKAKASNLLSLILYFLSTHNQILNEYKMLVRTFAVVSHYNKCQVKKTISKITYWMWLLI